MRSSRKGGKFIHLWAITIRQSLSCEMIQIRKCIKYLTLHIRQKNLTFMQKFHDASLGNCLRESESLWWISCIVFITTFMKRWTLQKHMINGQVLGTRCETWSYWYGQFEVGWLQPFQLWFRHWNGFGFIGFVLSFRTQVNVSQSCFHSLNKLLKPNYIVQVWGLVEVNKFH